MYKFITTLNRFCQRCSYFIVAAVLVNLSAVHADTTIEYFDVSGSTALELTASINNNSASGDGAFGYAHLQTSLKWSSIEESNGVCSIDNVDFSYTITVHMPLWIDKQDAPECLEQTHVELYRRLDRDAISRHLEQITPQVSCEVLKSTINGIMKRLMAQNEALHDAFHARETPPVLRDC